MKHEFQLFWTFSCSFDDFNSKNEILLTFQVIQKVTWEVLTNQNPTKHKLN